jgi:hypothetical protein
VARVVDAVGGQQLVGAVVVERCPLELEEQQLGLDRRALLLHALHERADLRVRRVDAEAQHRVVARARGELGDLLQLGHRGGEPRAGQVGDTPSVGVGERLRALGGLVDKAVRAGVALAVDEW